MKDKQACRRKGEKSRGVWRWEERCLEPYPTQTSARRGCRQWFRTARTGAASAAPPPAPTLPSEAERQQVK